MLQPRVRPRVGGCPMAGASSGCEPSKIFQRAIVFDTLPCMPSTLLCQQDSIAKQTVDIVLNQIINSKGVFVTADCANKFR